MADSVTFLFQPRRPGEPDLSDAELENANDIARNDRASRSRGKDDLRQRSMDSAKVIKIPDES